MVTIKATHIVRPAEATPDEMMYLNASDQIKDIAHTPTIYIYEHSSAFDAKDVISRLKHSLSKALVLFYPLAGRLKWAAQGGGRVELHCHGEGATILEAESDATVEDFGDFTPTAEMQALIPSVDYTIPIEEIPMLIVQITTFRCGGISIGLGVSHVVADGPSALHFVDEWAKISRGAAEPILPPYLDRKVLESDTPPSSAFDPAALRPPPALIGDEDNMEQRKKPIAVSYLNLSKLQIEKLRNKANLQDFNSNSSRGRGRPHLAVHQQGAMPRGGAADQSPFRCRFRLQTESAPPLKLLRRRPNSCGGDGQIRQPAVEFGGSNVEEDSRSSGEGC